MGMQATEGCMHIVLLHSVAIIITLRMLLHCSPLFPIQLGQVRVAADLLTEMNVAAHPENTFASLSLAKLRYMN